ncbi:hypothetical protein [Geoglobus ahangari]
MKVNKDLAEDALQILYELGENLEECLSGRRIYFSIYNILAEKNKEISRLKNSVVAMENKIKGIKSLINDDLSSDYRRYGKSQFKKGIVLGWVSL